MSDGPAATADLHCHSSASGPNGNWWYAQFGVADCSTPPDEVYAQAKARGMTFVTLTDHDSIDGALELAHKPDFIIGEEVTARFAEDGTRIDVIVLGLDSRQHLEIQARRDDVAALVRYLRAQRLAHFLAHPIYDPANRLEAGHLDRLAAYFPLWETRNGARLAEANELAVRLLPDLATQHRLATQHGIEPARIKPAGVGGSDDHGGLDIGTTYTVTPSATTRAEFLEHLRAGRCRPAGLHAEPARIAHMVARLLDRHRSDGGDERLAVAWSLLASSEMTHQGVARLAELFSLGDDDSDVELPLPDLSGIGRELGTLRRYARSQARLAPYLIVQAYLARERQGTRELATRVGVPVEPRRLGVALVADGLTSMNGVAETYRHTLPHVGNNVAVTTLACGNPSGIDAVEISRAATLRVPLYPDLDLPLPHLSELAERIFDVNADVIHVTGPGPLGLAGLAMAKVLRLPLVASYHTELADYAFALTQDPLLSELMHTGISRFYGAADLVLAPSHTAAQSVARLLGVTTDHVTVVPQGVDCDRFSPAHRVPGHFDQQTDERIVLCVARVSKEKSIDRLIEAFSSFEHGTARLVIVGDGPDRQHLQATAPPNVQFTGWLEHEELSRAYASADIFALASSTETYGQVLLEAQASGLPCVVSPTGAAHEAIEDGKTGIVAISDDAHAFAHALNQLITNQQHRLTLAQGARQRALGRSWARAGQLLAAAYMTLDPSTATPATLHGPATCSALEPQSARPNAHKTGRSSGRTIGPSLQAD